MTNNRPIEDRGKLLQDVPTAGAILDRFLHHHHRDHRPKLPGQRLPARATEKTAEQKQPMQTGLRPERRRDSCLPGAQRPQES
jgi:hypothetical protein